MNELRDETDFVHTQRFEPSYEQQIAALRAENERLREALEWYAAESDEKFQIVDSKGEAIANFQSFTSRARAALKDTPQ